MNRETYIHEGLVRHIEEFDKHYPNLKLFVIALQGSQNYDLDIYSDEYKSDIDTKLLVIPSLEDVVMNKKPISTTHICPNGEHIDIKDVRLYFDNFKKQNINFLEILFSDYTIVNNDYQDLWAKLVADRELVAHYNVNQALRCMAGMSMEKKKALCHPYPSLIEKIEKYGYDGKQLHHIIRMNAFIYEYALGDTFEHCLKGWKTCNRNGWDYSDLLRDAKLNKFDLDTALDYARYFDIDTNNIKNYYLKEKDEINKNALNLLNDIQYKIIKRRFIKDIMKEVE